jgi:hypothetical protein
MRVGLWSCLLTLLVSLPATAQSQPGTTAAGGAVFAGITLDGPPPPDPPVMMSRDARGKVTVRAIKLKEPLRVDGVLDDSVYTEYQSFTGMIQVAPQYGAQSTEKTEMWVMFDGENMYVTAKCWDSAPPDKWVVNELRRDTNQLRQNDHFGVMFDTFYDRRSGFLFYTNPLGALADYSVVDEGGSNTDWNPVWTSRTGRFDGGWTVEMAIPFKTLRYRSGNDQVWGIQTRRSIRHKNEWTYLTPVPQNLAGPQAFNRISSGGTLIGLDLPPAGRNLELKPYAISRLTTDRLRTPPVSNDFDGDIGGDVKYGINANLTADFTVRTDFAQVEIDEQQVNLTRFNLLFPEKRDFFLEGRGVFDFARGGAGAQGAGMGGDTGGAETPYLFYSRRIGLNRNRVIPIDVGGRLTGKVGGYGLGIMSIQAGDEEVSATPATNFTVMRVKRDILRRSTIGAMFTNRSRSTVVQDGSNQAFGVDAALSFYQNLNFGAYYARTATTGLDGDSDSYQAKVDYGADRYGARLDLLKVGDDFNPEVGFLRREDGFRRAFSSLRFSPRPAKSRLVRKYSYEASLDYILNGADQVESRQQTGRFNIEFHNSDRFNVEANRNFEFLVRPFQVNTTPRVVIPIGGYSFGDVAVSYNFGQQRLVSGNISLLRGRFYNGDITTVGFSQGRIGVTKRLSVEPSFSINRVELPTGNFTTKVLRSRVDYGFSPRMFASAFLQYSSSDNTFSSNLRYRWEYRPGSEFFIVWTDEEDTRFRGTQLRNRAFVVKATRLLRF